MEKIRIKNFGPIKEGFKAEDGSEWINIHKVTVFIGNQGSGKSTVAKLLATFMWLEKALNRGDFHSDKMVGNDIIKLLQWQRLNNYIRDNTEIVYIGNKYSVSYIPRKNPWPVIQIINSSYVVPKIMYVPAERNFLSTIKSAFDVTGLPGSLTEFAQELKKAQLSLSGNEVTLPFSNFKYQYDISNDESYVIGNDYKLNLLESSSGLQSLIPLYLVTRNLSNNIQTDKDPAAAEISVNQRIRRDGEITKVMSKSNLAIEEKEIQVQDIFARFHAACFINIVEEPEQNLFPTSQKDTLFSLLGFCNTTLANKLIITTHSPYMVNYLTLAIEAKTVFQNNELLGDEHVNLILAEIVPPNSMVDSSDVAIYEMNEVEGKITLLDKFQGIPSDDNKLNYELGQGNELFAKLLEI